MMSEITPKYRPFGWVVQRQSSLYKSRWTTQLGKMIFTLDRACEHALRIGKTYGNSHVRIKQVFTRIGDEYEGSK